MSTILRDGSEVSDHRFDLIFERDERSKDFRVGVAECEEAPATRIWQCHKWFDQKNEGACAAFGLGHVMASFPIPAEGLSNDYLRKELYWEAQRHDAYPGGEYPGAYPKQGGTSLLAVLKVAKRLGWIEGYHWGFGLRDLQMGVSYERPAHVGVRWYEGMYRPDKDGYLRPTGKCIGGHCICVNGVDMENERFVIHNSWGKKWGMSGEAYISFAVMEHLLGMGGQVAFVTGQHYYPKVDNRSKYTSDYDGGRSTIKWYFMINVGKVLQVFKRLFK